MIIDTLLIASAIAASGAVMVVSDWKWRMACLAVIQLIAFFLVVQIWPVALAVVKLISGWIGITIMSAALVSSSSFSAYEQNTSFKFYKLALIALTWMAVLVLVPQMSIWLPISYANMFCGLAFFLCGILFFSIHADMTETLMGLYIFLTGFDVIYSSLEGSSLVTAVYAVILIFIAILGSFLQGAFMPEEEL